MDKGDEKFMKIAIEEAQNAQWPFGAVLVKDGKLIAQAGSGDGNDRDGLIDPTAHAEVNVIRKACKKLKTHNLKDMTMYASCEPCALCIGAAWYAGIRDIVYGTTIKEMNKRTVDTWGDIDLRFPFECAEWPLHQKIALRGGIFKEEIMSLYPKKD
ncbi:MAG TPA: nucleoside deaminase [Candidatus Kaiserbacteria bacterium]|nr:nucleoside deaminase [Candidatus Kaiserbacteria bacterium]